MKKYFTKILGIAAMLLIGAWNVNGQNYQTITEELSFDCLIGNINAADWVSYAAGNVSTRSKCVVGDIPNLSGPTRVVVFNVNNCDSIKITGDGNKSVRYLTVQINDGEAVQTDSWPDGCSEQTFETGNAGDISISIAGVSGSVYLANVTFYPTSASLPPMISSFKVGDISATINQEAKTISAELIYGTDLTSITPNITLGGSATSYLPTGAQNFSGGPVNYKAIHGTDTTTYAVTLTTQATAGKELTELIFSNSFNAFIVGETVTAYYMAGQAKPTIQSYQASAGATVAISADGTKVVVTGADNVNRELALTLEPVTPFTGTTPITFDGTETWIKTGYSFDADKGWAFAKAVEEETNKRISEGKSRIYFFVGNYSKLTFTSGTSARDIKVFLNDGAQLASPTKTAASGSTFDIDLSGASNYMVGIYSNQTSGDGGMTALTTLPNTLVSVEQVQEFGISFDGKTIRNPNGVSLHVFDIAGRLVHASHTDIEMNNNQKGIYIVKSGADAMKICVK